MAGRLTRHGQGFTLIDSLVALAILAIALTAAFRGLGASLLMTHDSHQRQLAQWVAENRLAEIRARGLWPGPGRHEGEVRQGKWTFRWVEEVHGTPNANFRRVDVAVFAGDGIAGEASHALARLSGYATSL